jgi:Methyltransferase domain.
LSRQYAYSDSLSHKKLRLVDSYVIGGTNLLDFGAGTGELIQLEKSKFDNVYGVDSEDESIRIYEKRTKYKEKIHIIRNNGDVPSRLFGDIQFDWVAACDVLNTCNPNESIKLLKAFCSLLDSDGCLLLEDLVFL